MQVWVATRQADVLLYLGAFLLVVSALVFVSRQEGELATGWRVGLLATYTVGFLATGFWIRRWPRVQEAGPVFLAIGALFTPLNFVLIYTEVLEDRGVEASTVWFAGSSYSALFYGVLFRQGFGRLYALPAALALHTAWASLFFVLNLPSEWFGTWWMAFAAFATVALWEGGFRRPIFMLHPILFAVLAFLHTQLVLEDPSDVDNGPLPTTYALLTAGITYYGYSRRELLTPIATAIGVSASAIATLWAFGLEADWYAYPPLLVAGVMVATRPRWVHVDAPLARAVWLLAAAAAAVPVLMSGAYLEGVHGIVAHGAGMLLLAAVAWTNTDEGVLAEYWTEREPTSLAERVLFGWGAYVLLLITVAYAQRELGIERPDVGWSYTAIGALAALALAIEGRRNVAAFAALLPPFALATAVSLQQWNQYSGHDAIYLGVPAVELLLVFAWTRHWGITVGASGLAIASAAATWEAMEWELWTLALAYGAAGLALFAGLASRRDYAALRATAAEESYSTIGLTWGVLLAAPITAAISLQLVAEPGYDPPSTTEYRVLVALVAAFGALVAVEGWRLRRWDWQLPALSIGVGSLAAAWPVFDFEGWTLGPTYAAIGVLLLGALTSRRRYVESGYEAWVIVLLSWALQATALASASITLAQVAEPGFDAPSTPEYRALVALVGALGVLVALEGWRLRSWEWQVGAFALLAGAVGAAWPAADFEWWTLAPLYAAVGTVLLIGLGQRREYWPNDTRGASILILSWALLAAAPLVAAYALQTRYDDGAGALVKLVEYRALIGVVLVLAPLLAFEATRISQRSLFIVSGAVVITALEMTISTGEPTNVQAYTVPAALYAAGVSLVIRRSPMLIEPHLQWHELVAIVGAGLLVLPQAEQGFEPGGQGWALVLLIEGAIFLALSFALSARWLAVAGVLTMSGVAIRALWVNREAVPYWLMLGVAGLLLLAGGFVLLLQREWWDRARERLAEWWAQRALLAAQPTDIHLLAILTALAPAVAAAVLPLAGEAGPVEVREQRPPMVTVTPAPPARATSTPTPAPTLPAVVPPTPASTPEAPEPTPSVPTEVVFNDDFSEGGRHWFFVGPSTATGSEWSVVELDGNPALACDWSSQPGERDTVWALVGDREWDAVAVSFRFTMQPGDFAEGSSYHLNIAMPIDDGDFDADTRYIIGVNPGGIVLSKLPDDPGFPGWPESIAPGWQHLDVRLLDGVINIWVDGHLAMAIEDAAPLGRGGLALECFPGAHVRFDDVVVSIPTAADMVAP